MSVTTQNFPLWIEDERLPQGVASDRLGLYVHLPFCRTKCNYCAFVSAAPRSESEMDRYTEAVIQHIRHTSPYAQERKVLTVFFGGGTPSLMGAERLKKIFEAVNDCFRITIETEITIEANPESATRELFEALIPLGLNRVSLGAQSFSDTELRQIGRVHNSSRIFEAMGEAREAGIDNISLDLIFALPDQSLERWRENVLRALECEPDHLSSYGLTYEEGTLMHRLLDEGKIAPVLDEMYGEMYDFMQKTLSSRGWRQYEISNWCKPGRECRHNLIYWDRDEYLAFGVSAAGMFRGRRYAWLADKDLYIQRIAAAQGQKTFLPMDLLAESVELSTGEAASDAMIFGLRKTEGVEIASYRQRYGFSPLERWSGAIEGLQSRGLLEQSKGFLRLTPQAYLLSNEVMQYFLD